MWVVGVRIGVAAPRLGESAQRCSSSRDTNLTAQLQTIFDSTGKLVNSVGAPVAPTASTSRQIQIGLRLLF